MLQAHERPRERGVDVPPADRGISKALYFDDPAGNGVEVPLDTRPRRDVESSEERNERVAPTSESCLAPRADRIASFARGTSGTMFHEAYHRPRESNWQ
jgi:catechol-2,3-dioxygenase